MKALFASNSARRSLLFYYRFISRVSLTAVLSLAIAGLLIYVDRSRAAGGDIDTTFNAGGAGANFFLRAVAVQPDGKIVIGGFFTSYNGDAAASDIVMRLTADGTSDTTFNAGGAGANFPVTAVALQPDGKIVIGGVFTSYNSDGRASDPAPRRHSSPTRAP